MSQIVAIHPFGCACNGCCGGGWSVPLDVATDGQVADMVAGKLSNRVLGNAADQLRVSVNYVVPDGGSLGGARVDSILVAYVPWGSDQPARTWDLQPDQVNLRVG